MKVNLQALPFMELFKFHFQSIPWCWIPIIRWSNVTIVPIKTLEKKKKKIKNSYDSLINMTVTIFPNYLTPTRLTDLWKFRIMTESTAVAEFTLQ